MPKHILKKKQDFDYLFNNKKTYRSNYFIIFLVKNKLQYLRYAIIVTKKNFKTAVERNKIKRQIRTMVKAITNKNIGIDLIIFPKTEYINSNISYNIKKIDFLNLIAKIYLSLFNIQGVQ